MCGLQRNNHIGLGLHWFPYPSDDESAASSVSSCGSNGVVNQVNGDPAKKKMLIVDARSYAAALANRAKGGGMECTGK